MKHQTNEVLLVLLLSLIGFTTSLYAKNTSTIHIPLPSVGPNGGKVVALSNLEIQKGTCGWKNIQKNRSVEGNPLTICDTIYDSGVGTHATSRLIIRLNDCVESFHARIGIDDEAIRTKEEQLTANVNFKITLRSDEGKTFIVQEGHILGTDKSSTAININVQGWAYMILDAEEGEKNWNDHVDWANAYFEQLEDTQTLPEVVTSTALTPKLQCADRVFSQPGIRFMQRFKCTAPEAHLSASNLPEGLKWNAERQLIEGKINEPGDYNYTVTATYGKQTEKHNITLHVGTDLQQPIPLMGWLSWNVFEHEISEDKVRDIADAFVKYGLADAGYNYICLDDLWHANERAKDGKPAYDKNKFPKGLKALTDYIHSKGLKAGIYSDAAERTCAGAFGSLGYEYTDAKQYAAWGFDLLKYDYCHAPTDAQTAEIRYTQMGEALKKSGRDILFYLCEWGERKPWEWGAKTGGSCWRCTGDTRDCWNGIAGGVGIGGEGILQSIRDMKDLWPYQGVNRFNDADMMCIGLHGKGKSSNDLCETGPGMTQEEYKTQFALWCMWSSPLTLSFDARKFGEGATATLEDLALITNKELIAINQDLMGQQAEFIGEKNGIQTYIKDLENGDVAISVTNLNNRGKRTQIKLSDFSAIEKKTTYKVRDLLKQKDHCITNEGFNVYLPIHATRIYRFSKTTDNIKNIDANNIEMIVKNLEKGVLLSFPNTKGFNKRIILTNLHGHTIYNNDTKKSEVIIPIKKEQIYFIHTVCKGKSMQKKIFIK